MPPRGQAGREGAPGQGAPGRDCRKFSGGPERSHCAKVSYLLGKRARARARVCVLRENETEGERRDSD